MLLGLVLVVIGAVFFLQYLGYVPENTWGLIWPLIVVVIGIAILAKAGRRRK